jgi:hypothetical protein
VKADKSATAEGRRAIIATSRAMLDGQVDLIEGVRKICALRFAFGDPDNPMFLPFRGIDSETEHFPRGDLRKRYALEPLSRIDSESDAYLVEARDDILRSCRELIRALS